MESQQPRTNRGARRTTIDVYDANLTYVILAVPPERVHHQPNPALRKEASCAETARLNILCPFFESGTCVDGDMCAKFHVDTSELTRREIHVNYSWKSLNEVKYDRVPAGTKMSVWAPNFRSPVEMVPSEQLLVTQGSLDAVADSTECASLSHCAHYFFNRMCNRGKTCRYMHAVHVDPSAPSGEWAPLPAAVGPKSQASTPANNLSPDMNATAASGVNTQFSAPATPALSHCSTPCSMRRQSSLNFPSPMMRHAMPMNTKAGELSRIPSPAGATESAPTSANLDDDDVFDAMLRSIETQQVSSPTSAAHVNARVLMYAEGSDTPVRYRHDPYKRL